ncbi:MAG TPA: ABC transporter substrate-binding protein, partial [Clostridia bacterium]
MDKSRFPRLLAFLISGLTAVSLLAGCGTAPKPGDSTVVVGITQEPGTFDPFLAKAAGDKEILFNIFEGLVKCDAKGVMQPALAESYEISADAKTYTFMLRQGVVFHNEKPVTAEDAVYSLERASDQAGGGKNALPGL